MDYQATAKYLRVSPRKLRLLADALRRLSPAQAVDHLKNLSRRSAKPLLDVVSSAVVNAKQKKAGDALRFKQIEVMEGTKMKRWRAVSRGMAHGYKKRMTHIRIVLTDDEIKNIKIKKSKIKNEGLEK